MMPKIVNLLSVYLWCHSVFIKNDDQKNLENMKFASHRILFMLFFTFSKSLIHWLSFKFQYCKGLKGNLRPKLHPCSHGLFFVDFVDKEPRTKICGVLIRLHEAIKLQSFEFSGSEVIPANVLNISPLVYFAFFFSFIEKNLL